MANIPISLLPNVQPSGYTPNDLLVLVNYFDFPYTGVTKNTELSAITSYVFSSFTGNTSATCITDLYVTNLYGCSPINVNDNLIMTTGTSISSSNGTAKIELDSGGNPDTLFISTSSNDTYLQLDSSIEFISNNGYIDSYATISITEQSDGTIENIVYGNGGSPNIKWKMDTGTGGNPGSFYLSNSGNYNQNGEFISIGYDFTYGGYLRMGSKTGTNSLLTLESNKSGLYFDDSAPLSPYSPSRPYALFDSRYTIDIFTDRVSTSTDSDFSLRIVNQDNFKKSGLYAGYLNSLELASNDKTIFFSRDNSSLGYYGFNGASVGGAGGTILIGTGSNSYIESGITNTVVIGGNNIIANTSDTVYVPNLNIGTIGSNPSVINLGLDSNGFIVTGSTFTGNTSATCLTDLYVTNLYGCSPINVQDSLIMTTGTSISSSNGGGQIDLDLNGNPNVVLISNSGGTFDDSYLNLENSYVSLSTFKPGSRLEIYADSYNSGLKLNDFADEKRFVLYSPFGKFSSRNETGIGEGNKIIYIDTILERFNLEFSGNSVFNITYTPNALFPTTFTKLLATGTIGVGVTNAVLLGGTGLTATESDSVYVNKLNIKTVNTGTSVVNLGIDSNGFVVTGVTSTGLTTKSGTISGTTFTGTPLTYDVVFTTPYPSTSYSISISGGDARIFTYELKTTTGFRINTNSSTPLTGDVDWMTIAHGES